MLEFDDIVRNGSYVLSKQATGVKSLVVMTWLICMNFEWQLRIGRGKTEPAE